MDGLHRKHEFILTMWRFIKSCEQVKERDDRFWGWAQGIAETIAEKYKDVSYADEWLISYMKSLDKEGS